MDERQLTLQYGHLGKATYVPEHHVWEFSRRIENSQYLTYVETNAFSYTKKKFRDSTKVGTLTKAKEDVLVRSRPDLAPGLELFHDYEASSRFITAASTRYEPDISMSLATGNAVCADCPRASDDRSTLPVVVFAEYGSSNCMKLAKLENKDIDWPAHEFDSIVGVPAIEETVGTGELKTKDRPLQIIFADSVDEKNTWMAARFAQSISIFHPSYQRISASKHHRMHGNVVLDFNLIAKIPGSLTGGLSQVDIAFNPWYQQQIGIIDAQGNWDIWDIQEKHQGNSIWCAERGISGSLLSLRNSQENYDGWGKICWIGNVHHLLVCNRKHLALCRIDTTPPQIHYVDLNFSRESEWILDAQRSKANASDAFILTTSRVIWITIYLNDFSYSQEAKPSETSILLSWLHFRDAEDTTLRLAPLLVHTEFSIVLYSQLNTLAQVFRFGRSFYDSSIPVSLGDPSLLLLPSSNAKQKDNPAAIGFYSVSFQEVPNSRILNPSGNGSCLSLVKFTGQHTDKTLVESIYVARISGEGYDDYDQVEAFAPERKHRGPTLVDEDDSFVVDDSCEAIRPYNLASKLRSCYEATTEGQLPRPIISTNWIALYSRLFDGIIATLSGSVSRRPSFESWLECSSSIAEHLDISSPENAVTMADFGKPPALDDIEGNSSRFESLIDSISNYQILSSGYTVRCLPLLTSVSSRMTVGESGDLNSSLIHEFYDFLICEWILPLSATQPKQLRILKEKLIRQIIMELVLSRTVFVRKGTVMENSQKENEMFIGHESQSKWTSTHRLDLPLQSMEPEFSQLPSDQLPSSQFPSSQIESSQSSVSTVVPEQTYPTLCRYTTMKQPPLPGRKVTNTLSHWQLGTDPTLYDWKATTQTLQDEENMSEGQKSRQWRRKRGRRKQRLREEMERERQMSEASSRVPEIRMSGSQPTSQRATPALLSSQITDIPMSQIESGAVGSRKLGGGREGRKKRTAGF